MVGIGRVAKAEHDGDATDEPIVAPSENVATQVESEHGQLTFGMARTVMATPATRMTSALAAGRSRTSRPSKLTRGEGRFARTATRPMPVIVSARPALKATIRSRPNATRCSEIAASRTTSADGQGSSPPETPTANSERKLGAVARRGGDGGGGAVPCRGASRARSTEAPIADDEQPRDEVQPRVEPVGHDELRERERHEAEGEDADRVRHRHDQPEQRRVPRRAALADEVGGDDRLAVPGRERVRRAPEERGRERGEDHEQAQVRPADERREAGVGDPVGRLQRLAASRAWAATSAPPSGESSP